MDLSLIIACSKKVLIDTQFENKHHRPLTLGLLEWDLIAKLEKESNHKS